MFGDSDGRLTTRTVCEIVPDLGRRSCIATPPLDSMPHADSALVPAGITTREQFWDHVHEQLIHLLGDQRAWVCRFLVSTPSASDVL